jgi:hypothetical protein
MPLVSRTTRTSPDKKEGLVDDVSGLMQVCIPGMDIQYERSGDSVGEIITNQDR